MNPKFKKETIIALVIIILSFFSVLIIACKNNMKNYSDISIAKTIHDNNELDIISKEIILTCRPKALADNIIYCNSVEISSNDKVETNLFIHIFTDEYNIDLNKSLTAKIYVDELVKVDDVTYVLKCTLLKEIENE